MKLIWKVGEVQTGRYRSFENRSWPTAYFDKEEKHVAAAIYCEDEYRPADVKTGKHKELQVRVALYDENNAWHWRTMKKRAKTLKEAKEQAAEFFKNNPFRAPKAQPADKEDE